MEYVLIMETFNLLKIEYIIGKEIGLRGTPHLQGYIECPKKMRWTEFNLPTTIHWEKAKANREKNIAYCSKENNFTSTKVMQPINTISELFPWQLEILELALMMPDGRTCNWVVDEIGGRGKSSLCKYLYVKHNIVTIQGGKLNDIMNIIFNLDMNKVTCICIDIPRNNKNKISYSAIECILNGMITNTKFETGIKVFNPPNVIVFCNYEPDLGKLSEDRWNVITI